MIGTGDADAIGFARDGDDAVAVLIRVRDGRVVGREHRFLEGVEEETDPAILSAFLVRYYVPAEDRARRVVLPFPPDDWDALRELLPDSDWMVPQRGTAHRWLELADHNARHLLESLRIESFETEERAEDPVYALGRDLGLSSVPRSLVCIDISHNQGRDTVGSLVWFEAGRPRKSEYRKFKIEGLGQQDDFAAIQEVVTRYLTRRRDEQLPIPDLFRDRRRQGPAQRGAGGRGAARVHRTPVRQPGQAGGGGVSARAARLPAALAPEPVAPAAPADPGRGAPVRTGLQPEAAHPADDHLRAAQHPRRRAPAATAAAGAVRQPGRREVGLGLRARHRAGILHPAGASASSSISRPGPECPSFPTSSSTWRRWSAGSSAARWSGSGWRARSCSGRSSRRSRRSRAAGCSRLRRMGKRLVLGLEGDLFLVIHLMIAGRLRWAAAGAKAPGKIGLAAFDFDGGTLLLTEAGLEAPRFAARGGGQRRARRVRARWARAAGRRRRRSSSARLRLENHTLKRALTDPRLFSGIGNAYSDEILHRARLSPLRLTSRLWRRGGGAAPRGDR